MAVCVIEQQPLYDLLPVGQEIIFTVSNADAVANESLVKFCCVVHISNDTMPNPSTVTHKIGTFKATPNNAGVGIFDMRNIIENYVSSDNLTHEDMSGVFGPQYKTDYPGTTASELEFYPIHNVDKFTLSTNITAFMVLRFYVEYLGADDGINPPDPNVVARADGTTVTSNEFQIFNAYVKYEESIRAFQGDFGFDTQIFKPGATNKRFLTNMPSTQTCNIEDYGVLAIYVPDYGSSLNVSAVRVTYYPEKNGGGVALATTSYGRNAVNGAYAYSGWQELTSNCIIYFGAYPGNLKNWDGNFPTTAQLQGGSIVWEVLDVASGVSMESFTINVNCPEKKDFEPIRLCWLNQWGAWDYFTFVKKSTRSFKTKGSTYTQLRGSWNRDKYRNDSFRGGKKTFRVNTTEQIKINTDYVSEKYNNSFEDLINSPEVYMLEGFQQDPPFFTLNNYVTPVRLTSKSFTRKTVANENLIQYGFSIEKTLTLRTQSI